MPRDAFPADAAGAEHRPVDARPRVMRGAAVPPAREHDAAVAAAEAAAHDLLQRDVARPPVGRGELRAGTHHRRRPADIEFRVVPALALAQRGLERHGDAATDAAAAVFRREHDANAETLEEIDAVELVGLPR